MEITVHLYANKLENLGDREFSEKNFFFFIKTVTTEKIEV